MKLIKKVISFILAAALVLTALPFTFTGFGIVASASVPADSTLDIDRPAANVTVTEVTRVAYASNSMKQPAGSNSVIVRATPSGVPMLNGYFTSIAYAGETPVSTQVSFTPGVELTSEPTISCSNTTVIMSDAYYSNGTYTWYVLSGTATVGTTLFFTVTYTHTSVNAVTGKSYTNTYNTYGASYVEAIISPAGLYSTKRTYEDFVLGQSTKNRSYVSSYILGANTYGALYNNGVGEGSAYFESQGSAPGWTTEYGMMHYSDGHSASRDFNIGYEADDNRPISYIYYDRSLHSSLSDLNLRIVTANLGEAENSNERVSVYHHASYIQSGIVRTFSSSEDDGNPTNNSIAASELGLTSFSDSISGPGASFLLYFTGSGPSGTVGTQNYTVAVRYRTPAGWSEVYVGHSHSLSVTTYDKGALRTLVERIQSTDPTVMTTDVPAGGFKGYNPQSWYYSAGWEAFSNAYNSAKACLARPNPTQAEIDDKCSALQQAYDALEMRVADYSIANAYYNQALAKNKNNYTLASWAKVQNILDNYVSNYSIIYQPAVDKLAADLKNALDTLQEANADYSVFNQHLTTINNLIRKAETNYGLPPEKAYNNWSGLVSALTKSGCVYDELDGYVVAEPLLISQQPTVDGYVIVLERAINALSLASANYTESGKAESAYKLINLNHVVSDCATELTAAYNALVELHGKDLSYQSKIYEATAKLNDLLSKIQYKPADTTAAVNILAVANSLDRSMYEDMTAVDNAIANLESKMNLDIRYQNDINRAVSALQSAIDNLGKNAADYTSVDDAIAAVQEREELIRITYADTYGFTADVFYSNWSKVVAAMDNVVRGLDLTQQTTVDGYATAILNALNTLTENTADYSRVNELQDEAYTIVSTGEALYTAKSLDNLTSVYVNVVQNKPISEQATVDGYAQSIQTAIDELEYLPADYKGVNEQLALAQAELDKDEAYALAHPGYTYYTSDSVSALNVAIVSVVDGLDIRYQSDVDSYAAAIKTAISELECAPADYTQVDLKLLEIPSDLTPYTTLSVATLNVTVNSINRTLTADKQATVDRYITSIDNAVNNLKYKSGDYSAVTAAINKVPKDSSVYTEDSWNYLQDQINTVVYGLDITHQDEIDTYALAIEEAIEFLRYKTADYSAVNEAIENANTEINKGIYTEVSVKLVQEAIDAVERDYPINRQAEVDAFATAINTAVLKLVKKTADYTQVNDAIAAANAEIAKGYYSDDSVAKLQEAIDAVVEGYPCDRQNEVDVFAAAIIDATQKLEIVYADYTDVDDAIYYAKLEIESGLYTDETVEKVQQAIDAVKRDYPITRQEEVYDFAIAIDDAVSELRYKPADYTAVDEAIELANIELAKDIYTDSSILALRKAVNSVIRGYNILNQSTVDGYATAIYAAMDKLQVKGADYSAVNDAITAANEKINTGWYTDDSVESLQEVIATVEYNLPIGRQDEVDAYAQAIIEATGKLILKPADYEYVELTLETAEYEISKGIYTAYSIEYLRSVMGSVVYGYTIDRQDEVDAFVTDIQSAISSLELLPPDFSRLEDAIDEAWAEINKGIYTADSVQSLKNAIEIAEDAMQSGRLTINDQSYVDSLTYAVEGETESLVLRDADYTVVANAITSANEKINTGWYTDDSVALLQAEIDKVVYGLDITHQSEVQQFADNIVKLTNELALKLADYTELQKILDLLDNSSSEIYTNTYKNFNEVMSLISSYRENTVSQNMSLTIDKQSQVDEMAVTLQGYIDMLEPEEVLTESFELAGTAAFKTVQGKTYIIGVKEKLTTTVFKKSYISYENVTVDVVASAGRYVGTGSVVTVTSDLTGEVIATYEVVLFGDINGDALINNSDSVALFHTLAGVAAPLADAYKVAANLEGTRPVINKNDRSYLDQVLVGKMSIDQSTGAVG
ncbi:MAG: hypothetical protein IKJ69_04470 [Clostridia bacterium]|nr:hypothetical protein [Clostridia bacterium]